MADEDHPLASPDQQPLLSHVASTTATAFRSPMLPFGLGIGSPYPLHLRSPLVPHSSEFESAARTPLLQVPTPSSSIGNSPDLGAVHGVARWQQRQRYVRKTSFQSRPTSMVGKVVQTLLESTRMMSETASQLTSWIMGRWIELVLMSLLGYGFLHVMFSLGSVRHERNVECPDSMLAPGHLIMDVKDPAFTRWVPFNPACHPIPNYVADLQYFLQHHSTSTTTTQHRHAQPPSFYNSNNQSIDYLHGKTILVLGDDIDRNAIVHMCHLLDITTRVTSWTNPNRLAPQPFSDSTMEPTLTIEHGQDFEGYTQRTLPHLCEIPLLDFRMVNTFMYGMDSNNTFYNHPSSHSDDDVISDWQRPGMFEDRVEELTIPYLNQLGHQPNLIIWSSGMWDLHLFSKLNTNDTGSSSSLSLQQLEWWEQRSRTSINKLKSWWPQSQIVIRQLHRSSQTSTSLHSTYLSNIRINQLRNAQQAVAQSLSLPIIDFGKLFEGYQHFQHEQNTFPLLNPGIILPNTFLHHLHRTDSHLSTTIPISKWWHHLPTKKRRWLHKLKKSMKS